MKLIRYICDADGATLPIPDCGWLKIHLATWSGFRSPSAVISKVFNIPWRMDELSFFFCPQKISKMTFYPDTGIAFFPTYLKVAGYGEKCISRTRGIKEDRINLREKDLLLFLFIEVPEKWMVFWPLYEKCTKIPEDRKKKCYKKSTWKM